MSDCGHTKLFMDDVIRGPTQYPSCLLCQVESLERHLKTSEGKLEALTTAVDWVINDASYKPPELIGDVAERWVYKLREARGLPNE
jgi:hypothetical protein